MEKRLKMRISRMFQSSFGSCRARKLSDVVEKAVFVPHNQRRYLEFEALQVLSSPKVRPFPSSCKPACSEKTSESIHGDSDVRVGAFDSLPRKRVTERPSASIWGGAVEGWSCPPASPISPLNPFSHCKELGFVEKTKTSGTYRRNNMKKKKKKKKKEGTRVRTRSRELFPFSSSMDSSYGGNGWYISDDTDDGGEDETDTLFSSRSLSSSSSCSRRRKQQNCRRSRTVTLSSETGVLPVGGKVKDSFAVVKKSSDPYNDFRTSMVEMIVEKQIFSPSGLENLLQCFLSLNFHQHHKVIVEVFAEIWEALFSNWC